LKSKKYRKKSESIKVILIGLDGNIKLKQISILTIANFFSVIDGIPMRKWGLEIKINACINTN
jgi:hypothetical protein